jgi:hypothetical protein
VHRPSLINSNPQRKLLIHFELQKRRYYIQLDRIEKVSTFSRRDLSEELPDNEAACQRATSSRGGPAQRRRHVSARSGMALEVTDEARKPIYFIEIAAWQVQ